MKQVVERMKKRRWIAKMTGLKEIVSYRRESQPMSSSALVVSVCNGRGGEGKGKERDRGGGGEREGEGKGMGVVPLRFDCAYLLVSVTSLVSARHHLSTLVATDLRETLHDTILDAVKGENMQQGSQRPFQC
jgi:hypothetical protein